VDDRENHVFSYLPRDSAFHIERKRLEIGDFAIFKEGTLVAIFERKTLEDFGASIKDGRKANIEKLKISRAETGCKIIYIVENEIVDIAPDMKFNSIFYSAIESHIFHLMVRDDVAVIRTANCGHTAATLLAFMKSMKTLDAKGKISKGGAAEHNDGVVFQRVERNESTIIRDMLKCIATVGNVRATKLMGEAGTFAEKYASIMGKLPKSKFDKIDWLENDYSILEAIPGISGKTAKVIVEHFEGQSSIGQRIVLIANTPADILANIHISDSPSQRLGPHKAGLILKYLQSSSFPISIPSSSTSISKESKDMGSLESATSDSSPLPESSNRKLVS
jgi:ERCC4-type nuclease